MYQVVYLSKCVCHFGLILDYSSKALCLHPSKELKRGVLWPRGIILFNLLLESLPKHTDCAMYNSASVLVLFCFHIQSSLTFLKAQFKKREKDLK